MSKNTFTTIRYEVKESVAWIILNRPDAFNSFTPDMNKEITKAVQTADRDDNVRCIAFTGEGRAFCAGQDIKTVNEDTDYAALLRDSYHPMVKAIKKVSKPTVGVINGVAAGAGMSLALAADYRVVNPKSSFVSAFMSIALIPDSGFIYTLPRLVGYAKALEIATLDKPISGKEAVEIGLANELFELDNWDEEVEKYVQRIASLPTKTYSLIKRYMIDGMNESFEDLLEKEAPAQRIASLTEDHQEGLQAFIEKRKPSFTGK